MRNLVRYAIGVASVVTQCHATAALQTDQLTRAVLGNPVATVDQGALPGVPSNQAIHANFPRIVEQNIARLDAAGAAAVVDNLSERELSDLASLYNTASLDTGKQARLLPLLAQRLDGARLGRLSRHFGYGPVYAAVTQFAPAKSMEFDAHSSSQYMAPVYGLVRSVKPLPSAIGLGKVVSAPIPTTDTSLGPFLDMTPTEIYLDLRTAPVGALGATGALYESAVVLGQAVSISFAAGWTAGSASAWLMQNYAPSLYDAVGGTVANMVDNLHDATTDFGKGQIEKGLGDLFGLSTTVHDDEIKFGGDYGNSTSWMNWNDWLLSNQPPINKVNN